jgi:hypothetical protein
MILTIVILVLFGLFWLAELVAHFTKYEFGPTLSAIIWKLESGKLGLLVKIITGILVAVLFTHLEFHLP